MQYKADRFTDHTSNGRIEFRIVTGAHVIAWRSNLVGWNLGVHTLPTLPSSTLTAIYHRWFNA